MDKKSKLLNKFKVLSLVERDSLFRTAVGTVKCWKGTTYNHFRVMSDIVWKLTSQDYFVYTEVTFKTGGRADILAISPGGDGYVIEVLHSETDKKYKLKLSKYPKELTITSVKTKEFDINTWDL